MVAMVLLFLTKPLQFLPRCVLSAIVLMPDLIRHHLTEAIGPARIFDTLHVMLTEFAKLKRD